MCFFKCFAWDVANTNSNFAPSGKSIKTRVNNVQKRIEFRKLNTWKVIYLNQSKQLFSWLEYCSLHNNMQLKNTSRMFSWFYRVSQLLWYLHLLKFYPKHLVKSNLGIFFLLRLHQSPSKAKMKTNLGPVLKFVKGKQSVSTRPGK